MVSHTADQPTVPFTRNSFAPNAMACRIVWLEKSALYTTTGMSLAAASDCTARRTAGVLL